MSPTDQTLCKQVTSTHFMPEAAPQGTVVLTKFYLNRLKWLICCGLSSVVAFTAADMLNYSMFLDNKGEGYGLWAYCRFD